MVRQRKTVTLQHNLGNNNESSSSSGSSEIPTSMKTFKLVSKWKTMLGFIFLCIAVYVGILGYLETRVNTPFDDEKVSTCAFMLLMFLAIITYLIFPISNKLHFTRLTNLFTSKPV